MRATFYRSLPAAALLLPSVGCGSNWQADTQPATGTVSINGEAPEGLIVHLVASEAPVDVRRSKPFGVVDADGRFALRTYEPEDGAPVGTYQVVLNWPVDRHVFGSPDRLAGRYDSAAESPMTITVAEGQTELPPIVLEGVKVDRPKAEPVGATAAKPTLFSH